MKHAHKQKKFRSYSITIMMLSDSTVNIIHSIYTKINKNVLSHGKSMEILSGN